LELMAMGEILVLMALMVSELKLAMVWTIS
jgi:hypothetical protein